jgi:hypothetical protein
MDVSVPSTPDEVRRRAALEAINRIRLKEEPPPPGPEVDVVTTEEIAEHSPDGRPADEPAQNWGKIALAVFLFGWVPAILFVVVLFGGGDALLLGLVYLVVAASAAFPVWYAGIMRRREEREAKDIVRTTLAAHRTTLGKS